MSPLSAPVLGTSALLASPALYRGFVVDTMPMNVVLERYAVTLLVCWAALSVVVEVVFSRTARGADPKPAEATSEVVRTPGDDQQLAG